MSSMDEHERELERMRKFLRNKFGIRPDGGPMAIEIFGGLPPGTPVFMALDTQQEWIRDYPNETLSDFSTRVCREAGGAGVRRLIIGGLPSTDAQSAAAKAAMDWFYEHEADDVPPMEAPGFVPRPPRSPFEAGR